MFLNKTITLLVSGSIAAYKTPELVRELARNGASVRVAMSRAAQEFVTKLTLQTVSGNEVCTDLFSLDFEREIGHINLADSSDVILVAPASANIMAKVAHGIADDLLSSIILAAKCPVLFFPAMNVNMWEAEVTKSNVCKLKELGHLVIDPEEGLLACGWIGSGRLPEIPKIIDEIKSVLTPKNLLGTRVVVSAGPTHEPIDPVRFVSNNSSGKMGYALASVAKHLGADVTLISGPTNLVAPMGVKLLNVKTAKEMYDAIFEVSLEPSVNHKLQLVYMAAAVSDHRPASISSKKIKMDKTKDYELNFTPSPDILADLGNKKAEVEKKSGLRLIITGFAAETGELDLLIKNSRDKLLKKNADVIVGNFAEESFGQDSTRVWLIDREGREEEVGVANKYLVAEKIIKFSIKT